MISTFHYMNYFLRLTALNLIAIVSLVIIVFPFFLVIVTLGMASAEAYALWSRWGERRGWRHGIREGRRPFLLHAKHKEHQRPQQLRRHRY